MSTDDTKSMPAHETKYSGFIGKTPFGCAKRSELGDVGDRSGRMRAGFLWQAMAEAARAVAAQIGNDHAEAYRREGRGNLNVGVDVAEREPCTATIW